jgi:DNA-binding XRE family transcriptional regulator
MTPTEYRATLDRLGLSHARAAKLIGVSRQTSHSWEAGTYPVPPWLPVMLLLIEEVGVERVRKLSAHLRPD